MSLFTAITTLTKLKKLEVSAHSSLIPYLGRLTVLTHLRLNLYSNDSGPDLDLAPFTRLRSLVHLDIGSCMKKLKPEHLAIMGLIASLKSLRLGLVQRPSSVAASATPFTPLAGLTALAVESYDPNLSFLSRFNLEGLRELRLWCPSRLSPAGVVALGRATGLTRLKISLRHGDVPVTRLAKQKELGLALSRFSRLVGLSLEAGSYPAKSCFKAIGRLTALTSLDWIGTRCTNADVGALLSLRRLHALSITPWRSAGSKRIAPETLFGLAALPELRSLKLSEEFGGVQVKMMNDIHVMLRAQRHARGWPPLDLNLVDLEDTDEEDEEE